MTRSMDSNENEELQTFNTNISTYFQAVAVGGKNALAATSPLNVASRNLLAER